jgi:hypothetical protein
VIYVHVSARDCVHVRDHGGRDHVNDRDHDRDCGHALHLNDSDHHRSVISSFI